MEREDLKGPFFFPSIILSKPYKCRDNKIIFKKLKDYEIY